MAVGCVKTRWHHNAAPKPMQHRMKNMTRFPYKFNCLCWILLCWMWQVPLAWHRESDRHGAPSCIVVKTVWPVGDFVYKVERKCCIAIVTALRSLIKTESRTGTLRLIESHCQGFTCKWTSELMNTNLCSFPLCQLVPSWLFLSKWSLLRKNPSARLCMF